MSRSFLPALLACVFMASAANAEERIQGVVRSTDGRPQAGATVEVEGLDRSATTDADGRFAFDGLNTGTAIWIYAWLGDLVSPRTAVYLDPEGATTVDLVIEPPPILRPTEPEVAPVVPLLASPTGIGKVVVAPGQMAALPSLGQKDALRGLQLLPGVSASREGYSGLHVRGDSPSRNLVSLDGMTLYDVDRLFRYVSAFNMDAIQAVELTKDAFDASAGGRLSGALDLTGKTGRRDRLGVRVAADLLSVQALVETPIGRRASLLVAGRRSAALPLRIDIRRLLGRTFSEVVPRVSIFPGFTHRDAARVTLYGNSLDWEFYDAHAKLLVEPSRHDKLTLSFYAGRDTIDTYRMQDVPADVRARIAAHEPHVPGETPYAPATLTLTDTHRHTNGGLSLQWLRTWGKNVETRLSLGHSRFEGLGDRTSLEGGTWIGGGAIEDNELDDTTARLDLTARPSSSHALEAGVAATRIDAVYRLETSGIARLVPGVDSSAGRPLRGGILDRDQQATLLAAYVQDRWTPTRRLTLSPGVRVTRYDLTSETFVEPRLTASLALTGRLRLSGGWGVQRQFANRVASEDLSAGPRASWTLSDGSQVPVARTQKLAGGLTYQTDRFLLDAQVFHKSHTGLATLVPTLGWRTSNGPDLSPYFQQGEGTARGCELLVQGQFGRHRAWVAYTLTEAESLFPGLAGDAFPADEDQTHEVKIVDTQRIWRATLATSWVFATGRPFTENAALDTATLEDTFAFDQVVARRRNGGRLRDYHRLDVALHLDLPLGSAKFVVNGTVFNVYNRRNVDYQVYHAVQGEMFGHDVRLMGRTYNASVSLRF